MNGEFQQMMDPVWRERARKRVMLVGWCALLGGVALACGVVSCRKPDPATVRILPGEDAQLVRAQGRARASLDEFIGRLKKPRAGDRNFIVVAPIFNGRKSEHFWLRDVSYDGKSFTGIVSNAPAHVDKVQAGQRYTLDANMIADWMFVSDGKLVGGETVRVHMTRMDIQDRADLEVALGIKITDNAAGN